VGFVKKYALCLTWIWICASLGQIGQHCFTSLVNELVSLLEIFI